MATFHERIREDLQNFDFKKLLADSNWGVLSSRPQPIPGVEWNQAAIAEMNGVRIYEVTPRSGQATLPNAKTRADIHSHIETMRARENLVIFTDAAQPKDRTQSLWYWVKYEGKKKNPREHLYLKGQPGDLFLSKIDSLYISIDEMRPDGTIPLAEAVKKLSASMDVERVTKRFYSDFSGLRVQFIDLIEGIDREADRQWYASVLLNRLMFVYFLQKKGFIQNNRRYLDDKLEESKRRGADRYHGEFLKALFFEGFAKPKDQRSDEAKRLLGEIRYLNGGLFLPHQLELRYPNIRIPDQAFENVLALFGHYTWYLDDAPGAADNEINPDVLGYIFEKYINQKAFGAYYTRTEITSYLCEKTINAVVVDKVNEASTRQYEDVGDILLRLDAELCRTLLAILPKLSILDPACGSGAFLVAAMKEMLRLYGAVFGRIQTLTDPYLVGELERIQREHSSVNYYIRKRIITDNLYGVDIMEEAAEIARLRLFLFLVSAAQTIEQLEPLPNIDFSIMCGNSLIGLLSVDPTRVDVAGMSMLEHANITNYRHALVEKDRLIRLYRQASSYAEDLSGLRDQIEVHKAKAYETLNNILLDDFQSLKIKYEEAQPNRKAKKRPLTIEDIEALDPFHWGYEFDEIMGTRGGFDVIIANPPWEIFKPNSKEFFAEYSDVVSKKNMRIEDFEKEQARLLEQDPEIAAAWHSYLSQYPHLSAYYRSAPQFLNQISVVNGKKAGTDINLYKVFTEQVYNLLRKGGRCGIVIPSGIYTDLGTKQLRELLFSSAEIQVLFGLSNEKWIFEGVHHAFKIALLIFAKGGTTDTFQAAFRINPREAVAPTHLEYFLHAPNEHLDIPVSFVRQTSPDSLSVMEVKSGLDVQITEKMLRFPLLGEEVSNSWTVKLTREFDMTNDSGLFRNEPGPGRLPLYEGKMIWQFTSNYAEPRYWVDEKEGRRAIIGTRGKDTGQRLDYQSYRLGFRDVAASTNERTLIASIIPSRKFAGNTLIVSSDPTDCSTLLALVSLLNSFVLDWMIRQKITSHVNMFYFYQLPVPRLTSGDHYFAPLVERAARLICTTPEFDDLAREIGIGSHKNGAPEPAERTRLRAEIDGMVAHLYGLTEAEFTHILGTFPLVPEPVKVAAQNAFRDVERGLIP